MRRSAAILLAIPALLLAADSFAQSEEDFDPPPPPPEEYDAPPTESDTGDGSGTRERGRGRSRNRDRDAAVGLGGLLLGEILEEFEDQPRSRPDGCTYERAGGWMQPTQGVYLDDANFDSINFGAANSLNPQLVQINPWGVYQALLPMIAGRPTALVGVIKYRDSIGNKYPAGPDRSNIVIRGRGDCKTLRPVKVRFTLSDAAGTRVIYETPQLPEMLPLDGPRRRKMEDFAVSVPAADGLPPLDPGAFTIQGADGSPYTLVASIIRADTNTPTKLEVEVRGTVRSVHPLTVQFIPIMLARGAPDPAEEYALRAFARDLASEAWLRLPDVFPIRTDQMTTYIGDTIFAARFDPGQLPPDDPGYRSPAQNPHPDRGPTPRQAKLLGDLGDYLATRAIIGLADRVVAIVRMAEDTGDEFEWIISSAGVAESTKVVMVPAIQATRGASFQDAWRAVQTVAHELTHTLPRLPFAETQMEQQCGRNYHNNSPPRGLGLQLAEEGRPVRIRREYVPHMMGSHASGAWWISQCSFAHLIGALSVKPDPELWLVRAIVSREGGRMRADLRPGYDLMGVSDVDPAGTGAWSVRLRDGAGLQLAAWPFDPGWETDGGPRDLASMALRVPALPQARTLEIAYNGQVIATRPIPAQAPSLEAAAPKPTADRRSVRLSWTARSGGGKPLLASVYVSTNEGRFYDNRLFELPVTQAIVPIDPAERGEQVFKIVVTDGARSTERIVRLPRAP